MNAHELDKHMKGALVMHLWLMLLVFTKAQIDVQNLASRSSVSQGTASSSGALAVTHVDIRGHNLYGYLGSAVLLGNTPGEGARTPRPHTAGHANTQSGLVERVRAQEEDEAADNLLSAVNEDGVRIRAYLNKM